PHLDRVAGWETSAFAALEALAELRAAFGREPAERFVERLRARFALEASAAARFLGRFGLANLERFLRELEAELEASGDDPAAVVRFLRRAVAERRAAEEARPPETDVDAVPVMTIHRAKGLEFRHVYLLQAHKGRRTKREEPPFDAERSPGGELAYRLFERPNLAWADALERREAVAERELVRLLYVAMTRAKERLVIAGQQLASRASEGSFLPLLRERFEASRAAALVRDAAAGLPLRDEQGVLWRAPALETGWSDEPAPRPHGATVPIEDAAVLARDLDRLTARRIAAAARAGRPRFQRASDLVAFESDPVDDVVAETSPIEPGRTPAWARGRGVALHRAFELAPLAASDAGAWRAAARSALLAELPDAGAAELAELDGALGRLVASRLWSRLSRIEPEVQARELPVLVAAGAHAETGPIDGTLGTLDLVYRDPESGEIVVADFKTDEVASDEEAAVKVALYRPQLALYGRAVGHAFALPAPPRLELWLIALDRIVPLGSDDARDESG
ncbi:MAG TPA: 3'-5' exonuclease, partial [Thermoanaerobaculia bacterium]|nr:3'-5' exonuclease [Thermoanaerobaculia bacterium]